MKRLLTAVLALFLAGCGASGTMIQPSTETVKSYEIGETYEANTGSAIVRGGRIQTRPTFTPTETFTPPGRGIGESESPPMKPGQMWRAVSRLDGGGYLLAPPDSYPHNNEMGINADGSVGEVGWNGKFAEQGDWPSGQAFERVEGAPVKGSFEFEILYSGTSGETVKMTYREYIDGMQRADYSQDLSYNIAEQDTVSYKSIRMHVKEANSSSIRYEVVEDGELPWLPQ
mgnify:CR=1 FL=1